MAQREAQLTDWRDRIHTIVRHPLGGWTFTNEWVQSRPACEFKQRKQHETALDVALWLRSRSVPPQNIVWLTHPPSQRAEGS